MTSTSPPSPSGPHYSTLPEDEEPRLPIGTRVAGGRLEICEELGRGGMAVVYRARDLAVDGGDVAFKLVTAGADTAATEARYENEARLGGSLAAHPHVVRPLGVGRLEGPAGFEGRMFLVSELVLGVGLDVALENNRQGLVYDRACMIARDVARALFGLHTRGIVHRDIKPSNVLLVGSGAAESARLIDFGLAYATGDGFEPKSPDLTEEGQAPGTPLYMSPEQAMHHQPTPAFDVYSFGVMLYELFSGSPPYDGYALGELLARKCDPAGRPFPISRMCPELPDALATIVDRCMEYDAATRPTAEELLDVFNTELAGARDAASAAGDWSAERSRSGTTSPGLKIGPLQRASVIADGARPAGDLTRADLQRKAVAMPFVTRASEAEAGPEYSVTDQLGAPDPDDHLGRALVAAAGAVHAEDEVGAQVEPVRTGLTQPPPAANAAGVDDRPAPRRHHVVLLLVAALALALLGFGAYALWSARGKPASGSDDGATPASDGESVKRSDAAPEGSAAGTIEASPRVAPRAEPAVAADADADADADAGAADSADADGAATSGDNTAEDASPPDPPPAGSPGGRSPRPKAYETAECRGKVAAAQAAEARGQWSNVLRQSQRAKCWAPDERRLRTRLRIQALFETEQYAACARAGRGSADANVARWVTICRKRSQENSAP